MVVTWTSESLYECMIVLFNVWKQRNKSKTLSIEGFKALVPKFLNPHLLSFFERDEKD
jgi:hypothetical protein